MKRKDGASLCCFYCHLVKGVFLPPAPGGEDIADNYQLEEMSLLFTGLKGATL